MKTWYRAIIKTIGSEYTWSFQNTPGVEPNEVLKEKESKRQMPGHHYISSTESFKGKSIDDLKEEIKTYHPF